MQHGSGFGQISFWWWNRLFVPHVRLLAGLWCMLGAGRDLLAPVLFFLVHFFVVRDIAWIGHV